MDMLLTELALWGGLLLLFWAMRDSLGQIEADIARQTWQETPPKQAPVKYAIPEKSMEIIGHYKDAAIYRYVSIGRQCYAFDHIQLVEEKAFLSDDKRCVAPGLIYVRCEPVNGCVA